MQKTIYLEDGSKIYVDAETLITENFSEDSRKITLEKGRALFSVNPDPGRPFIVDAGNISVRAVGTEFNVNIASEEKILVAVTHGSVQILKNDDFSSPPPKAPLQTPAQKDQPDQKLLAVSSAPLSQLPQEVIVSGQEVIVDAKEPVYKIQPVEIKNVRSWKEGRLYFYQTPLAEVVNEINRYVDTKLYIDDPRLKDYKISLNFDLKHRKLFLATLELAMPITARKTPDGRIALSKQ